ncbi:zinc ribbon domain-containing protein [Streptomyces mirabilis]|uniref:zinc ribbon domain-containing protein n=1 Tax=Streptomyces mirabilis TaxID=68239 RepID=UPI00369F1C95
MRHLAAETGIAVVTVPAANTSKHCSQCLMPLRHRKAPDRRTTPGWKWAICPNLDCRWQGDRDQGAWRRIAARGLTHQTRTVLDRDSGTYIVRKIVENQGRHPHSPCDQPGGPVEDRPHSATFHTPRAQATQGTLPHQAARPGGQASGGARSHGPAAAAPGSPPGPARDDDQRTHQPTQAARSSTGRGIPPTRSCLPSKVARTRARHYVLRRIA